VTRGAALAFSAAAFIAWSPNAAAADPSRPQDSLRASAGTKDVRDEIPNLVYAYSAHGVTAGTFGAQAYGLGLVGPTGSYYAPTVPASPPMAGGGVSAWWSPFDRLTLIGDGARNIFGNFSPSAAAVVRLFGRPGDGFSLGWLGKYKVDGFAGGPLADEFESEIETGVLVSYARRGFHFDLNAIGGRGIGPDGEMDAEGRLRIGYDLFSYLRLGFDSQARFRVAGVNKLVGDRTWDFAGGPQILFAHKPFFAALTAGPTSMNIARNIGWTAVITLGVTVW
jgi:hypothetical protein